MSTVESRAATRVTTSLTVASEGDEKRSTALPLRGVTVARSRRTSVRSA